MKRMRRKTLLPPRADPAASASQAASQGGANFAASQGPDAMFGHLALTVLQQSHLCPLPLAQQPVYWQVSIPTCCFDSNVQRSKLNKHRSRATGARCR